MRVGVAPICCCGIVLAACGATEAARYPRPPAAAVVDADAAFALFATAVDAELRGDHAQAAECLTRALANDPGSLEIEQRLGLCLLRTGELVRARELLQDVREARPHEPAVLEALSRVYRELGELEPCIEVNFARLQLDPRQMGPYLEILDPLLMAQRFEDAFVLFSRAVDIYGLGGFFFLRTAGEMALLTERPRVAVGYLTRAQRLAPSQPELDELLLRARQRLAEPGR